MRWVIIPDEHQFINRAPHFPANFFLRLIPCTSAMPQLFHNVHHLLNIYLWIIASIQVTLMSLEYNVNIKLKTLHYAITSVSKKILVDYAKRYICQRDLRLTIG